jgi:capsular polysaccharide biosynthesis protein
MELRDYLAALRRHWGIWTGATVVGALLALLVFTQTPKTYESTSTLFVSVSPSIPNSASFVQQRVKSYPDIVTSEAVLAPVLAELRLDESLADLRTRVSAVNPTDTTQLHVTVTGPDPAKAAAIANAVADRFADVVETLETPSTGDEPVHLTVADPAVAPTSPSSPVFLYLLALGVVAGLLLGLAAAILRSRMDTTLHTDDDLRRAWGEDDDAIELLVPPTGRARRSALTGEAAGTLGRRLELRADEGPVRVALVSPAPSEERATRAFAEQVTAMLRSRGLSATVTGPGSAPGAVGHGDPRVRLDVVDPLAPPRTWKQVATHYDGVVVVVEAGRVDSQELSEMHTILRSAGIAPLALTLVPRRRLRFLKRAAVAASPRQSGEVAPARRTTAVLRLPAARRAERG